MSNVYAYRSLVDFHRTSTSGGAFTQLAMNFFAQGGDVVYGVVLDENLAVRHQRACTLSDCEKFKKSKYVQSDLRGIFQSVTTDISKNLKVLFTGTPCQINALYTYLDKLHLPHGQVYTIDVICNGAPSAKVWTDYTSWLEKKVGKKLIGFGFREKGDPYNPYQTKAVFADGSVLVDTPETACYNRLFLKKLIIPKKCFGCLFKREERVSDITLGDFWGCEDIFSDTRLHSGVSLVLINSEKGARLFADKKSDKNAIVERCIDKSYLKYQGNLRQGTPPPTGYDDFWTCYKNKGFGYVANKYADSDFPRSLKYRMRHYYRLLKHRLK